MSEYKRLNNPFDERVASVQYVGGYVRVYG